MSGIKSQAAGGIGSFAEPFWNNGRLPSPNRAKTLEVEETMDRTCQGCRALKKRSGAPPECELEHPVDPLQIAPMEACERPLTYLALMDANRG